MPRLENVDLSDEIERRIVLANLVEGVNLLEREFHGTYKDGEKSESRWMKFGFELLHDRPLVDEDGEPYGAIFKNNNYPYQSKSGFNPPKYVFAFRGTKLTPLPVIKDLTQDMKFISHRLLKSSRVKHALDNVLKIITLAGRRPDNVWLAGHSLGSATALAVGTKLVLEHDYLLETFLFNPPTVSSLFGFTGFIGRFIKSLLIAPYIISRQRLTGSQKISERFDKLSRSTWTPHLFINIYDPICNGYVRYFEHRDTMGTIGFERIGNIATQVSLISLIGEAAGREWEPIHLIPSANLTITLTSDFNLWSAHEFKQWLVDINPLKAHKIKRWLVPDLQFRNKLYRFDEMTKTMNEASASNTVMSQDIIEQLQREKDVEVTRRQALEEHLMKQEAEMTAMKEVKVQQDCLIEEMRNILLNLHSPGPTPLF